MKRSLIIPALTAATILATTTSTFAADVGVSIQVGQPGFYGRIDVGNFPPPVLVYQEPVIIQPVPVGVVRQPIYVHVPPGQAKNWPLAQYYFNETRGHIQWLIKKSPTMRSSGPDKEEVNIEGIFGGIDTSSLADVKTAIEKKDSAQFAATYKVMLESCYSCHKSVGRPYLKPMIPKASMQAILNMDPNATWPQ